MDNPVSSGLGAVSGAFKRSSSAISVVVAFAFVVMISSTAYHMLAFAPDEFTGQPEVQAYENAVGNVSEMSDWTRTQYYWSNNLKVAGVGVALTPVYFGLYSATVTNYAMGMALTYNYHIYGLAGMLAILASFFVHGLLELTGIYILAAVSLRTAWNLWRRLGFLTKSRKRESLRHKRAMGLLMKDFVWLSSVGMFFIFLAAPIEAYVSPWAGLLFFLVPATALAFLAFVGLFYASIVRWGLSAMRSDVKFVCKEVKPAFKGRWRPSQLSLLAFLLFFVPALIHMVL